MLCARGNAEAAVVDVVLGIVSRSGVAMTCVQNHSFGWVKERLLGTGSMRCAAVILACDEVCERHLSGGARLDIR